MDYFSTGIPQVDKMGKLNISGNITPNIWYRTILTETGKPYYLAISILSDIVYWYKPAEIRDEHTGMVIGWKSALSMTFYKEVMQNWKVCLVKIGEP